MLSSHMWINYCEIHKDRDKWMEKSMWNEVKFWNWTQKAKILKLILLNSAVISDTSKCTTYLTALFPKTF